MAATTASPDVFGLDPDRLRDRSGKRVRYVQYRDQKCIVALWTVGRFVRSSLDDGAARADYQRAVLDLNDAHFAAREFEDRIDGRFFKFDADAERRVRETAADGYSGAVADLRGLVAAHRDALARDPGEGFETRLFDATARAIAGGWFPTLATYYHALDPGEKIAESVERRTRRIEGEGSQPGVRDLLAGPLFECLDADDLDAVKGIDWRSSGRPERFVTRLEEEFDFLVQRS